MERCSQCDAPIPVGARFCPACGAPVAAAAEARKTVTILFCDVVGSTALGERLDPEVMRGVMSQFYAAIREPVARHGGTVEKVIGDALVAVFGIPVVHEDDALRAVRAALEMRQAVRGLGDVQARIGVNTGDVLAGDATGGGALVVGDAVNVAARLEQAAPPGEVLVGDATWTLVRHAARGERVAPVVAKGKREPLIAWRLDGVDPDAPGHRRRFDLRMVGREAELELLRSALERTGQTHRSHLVTVLGQPGIGKSRLVAELPRLGDEPTVLIGHCRAAGGWSLLEPLLEAARAAVSGGRDASESFVELMAGDPEAWAVAACLAPTGAAGAPDIAWALSRLFGAMAATRIVVIVVEDVHWADDALLDVVEQLVGRVRAQSLLVVCTARPEFAERRPGWGAGANAFSVALESLDDAETRRLLMQAGPALSSDQAERVIAAAEGNPLFAEHLAALVEDNDLSDALPRSIQVLLSARLEALPEPERQVVSVAAVAGREFPLMAVEALVGRPIAAEVEHLVQRELIKPTVAGRHQFGHALLQEAAYGLIPKRRRGELHIRLARWLGESGAGDAAVGYHLERAFLLRRELGSVDGETERIGEDAGACLTAAGRRADSMGDPLEARLLFERALDLLPDRSPRRPMAMIELAAAAWNLLGKDEVMRLLTAGAELAASFGLRATELRAQVLRLGELWDSGSSALTELELLSKIEAALEELDTLGDPRAVASALTARASAEGALGRAADAVVSARRALDLLRAADEDTVWALEILVWAVIESPTPLSEAEALVDALLEDLSVRPTVRFELIQGQAMIAILRGREEQAWSLLDTAREIEQDLGRTNAWRLTELHGLILLRAGRFEEARTALQPMVLDLELRSVAWQAALGRSRLALADVRLGHVDDARSAASTVHSDPVAGGHEARIRASMVLSEVHLAEGDADGAVELAREAVSVAAAGDWVLLHGDARLTLARAQHAAGDVDAAVTEANVAVHLYAAKGYAAGEAEATALLQTLGGDAGERAAE
jgi:class 3 adenylate cyclase/tetratricopeptide (TPR) repeat protein